MGGKRCQRLREKGGGRGRSSGKDPFVESPDSILKTWRNGGDAVWYGGEVWNRGAVGAGGGFGWGGNKTLVRVGSPWGDVRYL